jgi:hypothetical protein
VAGATASAGRAARTVLRFHDELVAGAPDELTTALSLGLDADGEPTVTVVVCWCGAPADGERVLAGLRALGPPLADTVGLLPYVTLQSAPDAGFPSGRLHYWKSGYLRTLTDAALDALLDFGRRMPAGASGVGLQRLHGAAARVPVGATAFPHRADQYDLLVLAQWSDPAESDRTITWARNFFATLRPHLEDAVYVNNLGSEGPDRTRSAFGPNHGRLAEVKAVYDPANVFRMNQNIPPRPVAPA